MNYNNNNIKNQNNNININNEYMIYNKNISDNSYDDSKINFSLTNNSTVDTLNNKYNMNSDYDNNIIYQNNNMIYYNNNNNRIQRNYQNQYIKKNNGYNNNIYNHMNNYNNQNYIHQNNNIIDNYMESNINNKFNINNSFDSINNFYNINNNNFILDKNKIINNNNGIYKNNININHIQKKNSNINNIKDKIFFKKLNLNIKLGNKDIVKEIIIDIENDEISEVVDNILKEFNLNENYFEPLLNIIEKAVNVLINFDKIKPSKYAMKNLEENKKIFDENNNDMDDSFILDLIEKKNYKEYFDNLFYDIYNIKLKQERNFSCSYKHRNHK